MSSLRSATILNSGEVLNKLQAELPSLLTGQPVVMLVCLYSSVAEGYAPPSSDVDGGLILSPGHSLSPYQHLRPELGAAAELEAHCGCWDRVDVRSLNDAPLMAWGQVVHEGVLVHLLNPYLSEM